MKKTEEWHDLCMMLGAGLKPHEYLTITFPVEHSIYKQLKFPNHTLLEYTKLKVKELGLPYDVYAREGVIYVVGRGAIS